ncbi:ATP-binding cassette domain-containing protein [Roseimaritima ulvae]|uniref:Putative multidrug resistance ABC transporter ATP-binding/permease protein YheI n=1 Tax=Roseimaritima ulvae TaxID=980254 RepID=A0A5B9QY20_9BACT|nr:hypothetical protein [Roseimaritima ulvae]QEG41996.1 putative multidrug resistance ABC transporter ATP-binding/permease protein YheI [Roseimaritima ulvae]
MIRNVSAPPPHDEEVRVRILRQLAFCLGVQEGPGFAERVNFQASGLRHGAEGIVESAAQIGVKLRQLNNPHPGDLMEWVREGQPVLLQFSDKRFWLLTVGQGRKVEVVRMEEDTSIDTLSQHQLSATLSSSEAVVYVAGLQLGSQAISTASLASDSESKPVSPVKRFLGLMRWEKRDLSTVVLFAFVAGVLTLATPLAIESLVNVVSWGTYVQPLLVLSCVLLVSLGLAGTLRVLQTVVVEIIQRRQFVRIVGDLAYRLPRANQAYLQGIYPREFANRVFDVMTIQKATAVLLLDGVTLVLSTLLGMLLLAFYHPFLLGVDIVLLLCMGLILGVLGRGGIQTAVNESKYKYKVVHWLQDTISMPLAFKFNGGESLAVFRTNELTARYIAAREQQFAVVIRQVAFAVALQAIASTGVLGLGGWLVITGQLTLGQLVASELVVTLVVGAFAKAGKSLEKFYDLMAGVDKVGQLLDIPYDQDTVVGPFPDRPAEVRWSEQMAAALRTSRDRALTDEQRSHVEPLPDSIPSGVSTAVLCDDACRASQLVRVLAGLEKPSQGAVEVGGYSAPAVAAYQKAALVAYAGEPQIFHGTLAENIDLGRGSVSTQDIHDAMHRVGLGALLGELPDGLSTALQTDGYPLTPIQAEQLMLARAIAAAPRLLVIDCLLDDIPSKLRTRILETILSPDAPWTLVLATRDAELAARCQQTIHV